MAESFLAKITPVQGGPEGPVDPGFGHPKPPNQIWPPPTLPPTPPGVQLPIIWPPQINNDLPTGPIVINPMPPLGPDKPQPTPPVDPGYGIPAPPGTIWPPLPPGTGIAGKALILIWVVGVGYRWLVVDGPDKWPPSKPPEGGKPEPGPK